MFWVPLLCLLVVDEKRHSEDNLEEAADGADLYGVDSLDGFHQEGNDGEENRRHERIKQTHTWTFFWFLQACKTEWGGDQIAGS